MEIERKYLIDRLPENLEQYECKHIEQGYLNTREFDSWISRKVLAGLIKPAFFMSIFMFYMLLFYVIVYYNKR